MCCSRQNSYPPHGRSLEIPRGKRRRVLKANFLEAMYENKLAFPGEKVGGQNKKPFVGGEGKYGYFLELHINMNKEICDCVILISRNYQLAACIILNCVPLQDW